MAKIIQDELEDSFVSDLKSIAGEARSQAYRAADHLLVVRNWLIGWRIVEQEQNGKERAEYGKRILEIASQTLTQEFGKGFGLTSIKNMRSFYLTFNNLQISQAMLDQFRIENMYIRMYDELKKEEGSNPTIGLLLCSDTSKDLARYSILKDSKQLYAAKYLTYLPTEEELSREIREQKEFFELQKGKRESNKDTIEE